MCRFILNLQIACKNLHKLPQKQKINLWIRKIFSILKKEKMELTIRIVDENEMLNLNYYFLKKQHPTNVLSFPAMILPIKMEFQFIGDIVICQPIIEYEYKKNNISSKEYWAYIIVHGLLHLLGYDHFFEIEAQLMQNMETNIMKKLGYKSSIYLNNFQNLNF